LASILLATASSHGNASDGRSSKRRHATRKVSANRVLGGRGLGPAQRVGPDRRVVRAEDLLEPVAAIGGHTFFLSGREGS
jgi:hypothetical protein